MTFATTGWGQVSITGTSTINENLTGYAGTSTVPTNWNMTGSGSAYAFRGTAASTGTSGGWYGSDNMSFLGSSNASNGRATWQLQNNTGGSLVGFDLSFVGRLWKTGTASPVVRVYYLVSSNSTFPAANETGWTEITSLAFSDSTANVSTGATRTANGVSATIANGSYLYLRWLHPGGGSSDNLGWDSIQFTATAAAAATPTLTAATLGSALAASTYGTASAGTSFTAAGTALTGNITVTAQSGFEVSTSSGSGYGISVSVASGTTVWVRTAATRAAGAFNSTAVAVLSGGGAASSANVTSSASNNSVGTANLTITGLNAANKSWDGNTAVSVTGTPAYSGLVNGESFSVTGTVSWAFLDANVGSNKTLTRTGNYNAPSSNYTVTQPTLTASINAAAPGAPTDLSLTPGNGQLTASFTAPASNGGSAITNYEYSTNGGSTFTAVNPASTSTSIVITGLSNGTSYNVQVRAVNAAGSGTATATVAGTPAAPSSPTISVSPATFASALSTTYGTSSSTASFTVSGATLSGNLTVTAPTGLEVSLAVGGSYSDSLELTATSGTVTATTVYARLRANAAAGNYNGQSISATGGGASTQSVATTATGNTVTAKTLTITGLAFQNKVYDRTTTASATGTAALSGVESIDTANVILGGTPVYSFSSTGVGNGIGITTTGYSISGSASGNYSLTQPSSNANITVAPLTVLGANATDRAYNALTTVAIAGGTLSGVIAGDTVTLGGSPAGTVETAALGDGKLVTVTGFSISGTDAGNYSLSQPTGLTVNITKASQTILGVAATTTKTFGDAPYSLGASVGSGQTLSYSSDNNAVATVSSAGLVTIVGPGSANISVSQAGNDNYSAATTVTQALTVNKANQTITFGALASKLTTDSSFALNATASSGGAVTYTSSNTGVATVLGNTVMIVGPGTTTITASSAASDNYNAATDVTQSLFVNPPPTALAAGDIAFLQYDSDNPDKFTFITLVDLAAGTVINFTDNGFASATTGRTGEGFLTFTVPNGTTYTAGTVFTWTSAMTVTGTPWSSGAPTNFSFNAGGDQLFAFQGSTANWDSQIGITLVAGLSQNGTAWITTGTAASGTSYQPSGLPSSYIVSFATDNAYFANGTTTSTAVSVSGTKAELQGLFFDGTNKWYKNSTGPLTAPTFTIALKQSQTISFSSIPSKTYGDASFDLTATASSGLTVSYASANTAVATVSGSTVTIVGAGTTIITASQAGNSSYASATSVQQTLTVAAKSLTGSFTADNKFYDGTTAATVLTRSVSGKVGSDDVSLSGGTATFASANVGNGQTVTLTGASLAGTAASNYTLGSVSTTTANITAALLASGDITLNSNGDGSYTASATGEASFTYSYVGRSANGITTSYSSSSAPTDAGYYTVSATATGNYSGSNTADYFVAGPVAVADSRTKSAGNADQLIPISEILANDRRITSTGTVETTGLTVTEVRAGAGSAARIVNFFVQTRHSIEPTDTFTYTVTDGAKTATATVTITTEVAPPSFTLQIVKVGTATFAGGNTTVTHDFIGVPGQTYLVEYTTDLAGAWTSAGNQSTGATGSFSVTFTKSGDVAADWNAHMFFRARLLP